jgi:hypothetical protein
VSSVYSFSDFVSGVYLDLGEPIDYTPARLSGWFLDAANIGKVNNLIGTHISGVALLDNSQVITGYSLEPNVGAEEYSIYKHVFEYEYYKSLARNVASSALQSSDWVSLREGDSSITRINKNELSKNFKSMASSAKEDLELAVKMYLKYHMDPTQVVGDDTEGIVNYSRIERSRNIYYY